MAGRFIKLYDKILNWEWARYPHTFALFIYLLLKANYKDTVLHGVVIRRGQLVTSLPKLATDTGLSIQQTRTAIARLISTGEITDKSNPHYRIITIVKYDEYQSATGKITDNQQTNNRQSNRQSTDSLTPCIEDIELIESQNYRNIESPLRENRGQTAKRFSPPSREEIEDFCLSEGIEIDIDFFLDYYTSNGWKVGKSSMKDWRATVRNWARRDRENNRPAPAAKKKVLPAQDFEQRDYSDVPDDMMRALAEEMRIARLNGELD